MSKQRYDFDSITDRRGTGSLKWNVADNELPMWVADMDFPAATPIREAMEERLKHGVFGYSELTDGWYEAYTGWWRERHHFDIKKEWLIFSTGVIPSLSSTVRKLTTPNEKVIIQPPVYNIFYNSIRNNGCRVLESPLRYENGEYTMDLDDLEKKMSDPQASLMFLCNPQNPAGKLWDREILARIGDMAAEHHVTVVSDEIHCDITAPGTEYIPFASVSDKCRDVSITCIAPTKAFNIAGTQTSAVMIPDPYLRHKIWRALNTDEVAEPNCFAEAVTKAAFNESGDWLDEMREYVYANRAFAESYIEREIPDISVVKADATYLIWIDISSTGTPSDEAQEIIRRETGLFVSDGLEYGEAGRFFLRMNLACPRKTLTDGLDRLKKGIMKIQEIQ